MSKVAHTATMRDIANCDFQQKNSCDSQITVKSARSLAFTSVIVGSQPQKVTAFQESPTSVRVFWETPQPIGKTTGYRIYYTSPTSSGSVSFDDPLTSNEFVYGLTNGETYTFSVAGRSIHFESEPSIAVNLPISLHKYTVSKPMCYSHHDVCHPSPLLPVSSDD